MAMIVLGALEALKEGKITQFDSISILMHPVIFEKFESILPEVEKVLHLGSELGDVKRIIPELYEKSFEELREMALDLVDFKRVSGFYFNHIVEENDKE